MLRYYIVIWTDVNGYYREENFNTKYPAEQHARKAVEAAKLGTSVVIKKVKIIHTITIK